jgi:translocation and assembly module TamA
MLIPRLLLARATVLAAAAAFALPLVAACGRTPRPVAPGQRQIGAVDFRGTTSVDDDELHDGLGLVHARESGQPFARFLVAQDRLRIQGFYLRRGYLAVEVEPRIEQHARRADVTFDVDEGKRATLQRVEIVGLPRDVAVKAEDLRELIPIDDGDPFDYEKYELARAKVPQALAEAGYARAKVEGVVLAHRERGQVVIRLDVELGDRTRFGDVKLVGVPAGLEDAVRHRLRLHPGQLYSPRAIEDTRVLLYELGRFNLVKVELDQVSGAEIKRDPVTGDEIADVTVTVSQAARHDLRLGGGVGLDPYAVEVRGRAVHSVAGWPWPTTTSRVELRPAVAIERDDNSPSPRIDAVASIVRMDFLWPRYSGAAEASYAYLAVEAYTSHGPRLRLSARTPRFKRAVQASVGWQLGLTTYGELSPAIDPALAARLGLDDIERVGSFDQSLTVDLRDDKLKTHRGAYFELRAEEGTVAAGGAMSFLEVVPDMRAYYSLGPVTMAARARAGWLVGDVPATRRFFGGGAGGYRGLPGRQLSPFATTADGSIEVPYGGTAMLDLSTEVRVPITTRRKLGFGVATFLDGGDVTEGWDELDAGHLHWAAGAGLRVSTLVGAIRADLAYRLTRSGPGEPRAGEHFAYHLGIGEAF